jgi:ferric-dicitrate binding protein FerR (iron transport regulator)
MAQQRNTLGVDMSLEPNKDNVSPLDAPRSVQAQASAWLAKLDNDKPSSQDLQAFKQWVNQDEAHIAAFKKVAAAWDELNILTRLPLLLEQKAALQSRKQSKEQSKEDVKKERSQKDNGLNAGLTAVLFFAPASNGLDGGRRAKNHYFAR